MLADWAGTRGVRLEPVRLFEGDRLPDTMRLQNAEGVIILGGPMGVDQVSRYPWLSAELNCIREILARDIPLLGICLGAQLIAAASGAKVGPMGRKEIGWWPVDDLETGERFTAFHWHGDRFELPSGATRIYSNTTCREQGFRIGRRVTALQFHVEMNRAAIEQIILHSEEELNSSFGEPTVEQRDSMLERANEYEHSSFSRLTAILDELF